MLEGAVTEVRTPPPSLHTINPWWTLEFGVRQTERWQDAWGTHQAQLWDKSQVGVDNPGIYLGLSGPQRQCAEDLVTTGKQCSLEITNRMLLEGILSH